MKRILVLLLILALSSLACADHTADRPSVSSASGEHGEINIPVLLTITNVTNGLIHAINIGYNEEIDVTNVRLLLSRLFKTR